MRPHVGDHTSPTTSLEPVMTRDDLDLIAADGTITDPYRQFIAVSRYARWLDDEGRRETWAETVNRYVTFFREHLSQNYGYDQHDPIFADVEDAILHHRVMPSMRALMTAGPALHRSHIAGYNCAFIAVDDPRAFDEAMYILLNGTGVGFSVERRHVEKLPPVPDHLEGGLVTITPGDSKEGWAEAFYQLLESLWAGLIPDWDLTQIRPAGARLKTFGGRASGPEPLDRLFQFAVDTFKGAIGRRLHPVEAHDLMCMVGDVVVSGGVRRSALISLSDLGEHDMATAKSGAWWETTPHRRLANNSAVYTDKPSVTQFLEEWRNLIASQSGERGIYNLAGAREHATRQGRDGSRIDGTNPCLTGDTVIATIDGPRTFADLAERGEDVLVYSWEPATKKPVVKWMRRPHRTAQDAPILKVTFDSGLVVRCTPNHGFYSFRGQKIEARNLIVGQSIRAFSASRDSSGHERIHGWDSQRNAADHQWTHRMLWETLVGPIPEGYVIAHLDGDGTNNDPDNLALMSDLGHRRYDMPVRQAAGLDGHSPNHKVVAVESDGHADVYNGMVEDSHSYIVLDADPIAGHMSGIVSANCGEILLRSQQFCNLTEVVIHPDDTVKDLCDKVRLATIVGTWQSTLTDFTHLREQWRENCEEERLLGVSLTGIYGHRLMNNADDPFLPALLEALRGVAHRENEHEAGVLGINPSSAITTVKPSGTVSQLTGVSSGIHPWHSAHYIRTVRANNTDPLTRMLIDYGVPHEPDVMNPTATTVFSFPVQAPAGAVTRTQVGARDHIRLWAAYREHWTDHNPSVTINVREDEWLEMGDWVFTNWDRVGGVSFLPHSDHTYAQAPYTDCDVDTHDELRAAMPKIDWSSLSFYEKQDTTTGSQELACTAGACEVVDLAGAPTVVSAIVPLPLDIRISA
jgi:ribonucleotide reductase alpha subunit